MRQKLVAVMLIAVTGLAIGERVWTVVRQPDGVREIERRVAGIKAKLDRAVLAAERAAGGKAVSVRLDDRSTPARWIIGVEKSGKQFDVVVESTGEVVAMRPHATSIAPSGPHANQRASDR